MANIKLVNQLDHNIMYSLNKNKYLELKPQESVNMTLQNIYITPTDSEYVLSGDELGKYKIKQLIVGDIKAGYEPNSMVVSESIGHLRFLYTDFTGMGKRLYSTSFDITDSVKAQVDHKKVINKFASMTDPNHGNFWWIIIVIFALVICMLPVIAFVIVDFHGSKRD